MDQLAKKIKLFHDKNSDSCADNTSSSGYNDIKTPLWNVMRPHQKEAFQFLVSRLLGIANTKSSNINSYSNSSSSTNANCIDRNDSRNIFAVQSTGAVLADDMGTGKTLVGIAVLHALCCRLQCKGIIVCPPTLIANWEKEIKHWQPGNFSRTTLYVKGSSTKNADLTVNKFVTCHATVHPLLVIGYEMFRNYLEAFNTMNNLELLLCDEGHRIKNINGTKTSLALNNCCAMRRVVLTGTPIQNNLEELYTIINFIIPNYFGDIKEFRTNYISSITQAEDKRSTKEQQLEGKQREAELKHLLSQLILRRTKEAVLRQLLPSRKEFVLLCPLGAQQNSMYQNTVKQLIDNITGSSGIGYQPNDTYNEKNNAINEIASDSQSSTDTSAFGGVLSSLMKLRLICNSAMDSNASIKDFIESGNTEKLLELSAKLQVVDDLVTSIRSKGNDKIIIASNFTTTLDLLLAFARHKKWCVLRIDGQVSMELRGKIIKMFNGVNNNSPFFVLLLSTKAGGVGLNLVSANRMILMDPDWNPATDQQTMGRVWRDGQTKKVFIYRLLSANTIEESIYRRQNLKLKRKSVITENEIISSDNSTNYHSKNGSSATISYTTTSSVSNDGQDVIIANSDVDDQTNDIKVEEIFESDAGCLSKLSKSRMMSLILPEIGIVEEKEAEIVADKETADPVLSAIQNDLVKLFHIL